MSSPKLPESSLRGLYSTEQMRAYGKACRDLALQDAAQVCDDEKWVIGAQRKSTYMETYNKACGDCAEIMRVMS